MNPLICDVAVARPLRKPLLGRRPAVTRGHEHRLASMCVSETRGAPPGGARSRLESPGAPSITKEPLISHHDHFADTRPTRVHHPLPNADRFALVIYSFEYQGARFNGSQVLLAPTVVLTAACCC